MVVSSIAMPTTTAAQASPNCDYPYCSETFNKSQYQITVARDWCGSGETYNHNTPPCGGSTAVVFPGYSTDPHQDWDTFRVDAHWMYTVQYYSVLPVIGGWSSVATIDRRGSATGVWIRVHNDQTYYILKQTYG
jgi:hypothetical protein